MEHESPPDIFFFITCTCECLVYAADFSQRDHLHLRQPGGGVPQTSDGPGSQADLPGHLQLHQVPHQAGVREIPAGMMAHAVMDVKVVSLPVISRGASSECNVQ